MNHDITANVCALRYTYIQPEMLSRVPLERIMPFIEMINFDPDGDRKTDR